jgi:hypothetical protein
MKLPLSFITFLFFYQYNLCSGEKNEFKIDEKAKSIENKIKKICKKHTIASGIIGGIGARFLYNQGKKSIIKRLIVPAATWTCLHTLFLATIQKNQKNLLPISRESITGTTEYNNNLYNNFPIFNFLINFLNKIILEQTTETKQKQLLNTITKNGMLSLLLLLGFFSPDIYNKIEKEIKKIIIGYVAIHELGTIGWLLLNEKNRNLKTIKKHFADHLYYNHQVTGPDGKKINQYPLFSFIKEMATTALENLPKETNSEKRLKKIKKIAESSNSCVDSDERNTALNKNPNQVEHSQEE